MLLAACLVINQWVLIESPALCHTWCQFEGGYWPGLWPQKQQKPPMAPSMASYMHGICPLHKGRSNFYSHISPISQKAHVGVDQYVTPSNPSSANSVPWAHYASLHFPSAIFFDNVTLQRTWALSSKFVVMNILTSKEKWNLIAPYYAVLQTYTAWGIRSEYSSSCGF